MFFTLLRHELRQSFRSLLIWTACIAFFIVICIALYPSMKGEMDQVGELFSSMGSFSSAFGLDRLNFGSLIGFYAVECGNILGLGAALFAAMIGITALSREENGHTAEFLLTQPVSRFSIVSSKLASVLLQVMVINLISGVSAVLTMLCIGEPIDWKPLLLLNLSYLLVHLELACITFCISAFCSRNNPGIGLGLAVALYFINIVANISAEAKNIKYLTPFAYCEGADIVTKEALDGTLVAIGMGIAAVCIATAYAKYLRKDIR